MQQPAYLSSKNTNSLHFDFLLSGLSGGMVLDTGKFYCVSSLLLRDFKIIFKMLKSKEARTETIFFFAKSMHFLFICFFIFILRFF